MDNKCPTDLVTNFGDGQYRFWLPLKEVAEFEGKFGSILSIEPRLRSAVGLDEDNKPVFIGGGSADGAACREIVRLGLIGGKAGEIDGEEAEIGPQRARELIDLYAWPNRPLGETAALAWRILAAAIYGNELHNSEEVNSDG